MDDSNWTRNFLYEIVRHFFQRCEGWKARSSLKSTGAHVFNDVLHQEICREVRAG